MQSIFSQKVLLFVEENLHVEEMKKQKREHLEPLTHIVPTCKPPRMLPTQAKPVTSQTSA